MFSRTATKRSTGAFCDDLTRLRQELAAADAVLVFSCGVGVQTLSAELEEKPVYAGCDTYPLPGFQGVTPLEYACDQCGECWLNLTGGTCPITACSKSLVNGPCGGAKNGKCEVNPENDCAWVLIYNRLKDLGQLDKLSQTRDDKGYADVSYPRTINIRGKK